MKTGLKSKFSKNNKGYSLVELIVVIAIIAVLGVGATWSIILVFSANAKTCANDIVGAISECKIETMSKGQGSVKLKIYRDGAGGTIYSELLFKDASGDWSFKNGTPETGYAGEREKVGASRCSVGTSDGADDIPTSRDTAWEIYFNRSTGSFADGTGVTSGGATTQALLDNGIWVMGGSKNYYIKLEKLTGKTTKELQ